MLGIFILATLQKIEGDYELPACPKARPAQANTSLSTAFPEMNANSFGLGTTIPLGLFGTPMTPSTLAFLPADAAESLTRSDQLQLTICSRLQPKKSMIIM
jgi:hypothetical protein